MRIVGLTEENRRIRRTGVGASEVASLFGLNPFEGGGVIDLWKEKCGIKDRKPAGKIFWGNLLEPVISEAYTRETGSRVIRRQKTLRHKKHKRMLCTPDYKVRGEKVNVQVKTASAFYANEWGDQWTDQIPIYYLAQVQQEMEVLNYPVTHIPVLIGNNDFRIYRVERDHGIGDLIADVIERFWLHVENRTMPEPITVADYKSLTPIPRSTALASADSIIKIMEHKEIKEIARMYSLEQETMEDEIRKLIGKAEALVDAQGNILATWKGYKRRGKPYRQLKINI